MLGRGGRTLAPAAAAMVYIATLVALLPKVLAQVSWDADAIAPMVLAESLARGRHGGQILVGHMAYYPMLGADMLTHGLPFHRQLWTILPYLVSLAALALLTRIALSVGGHWAATVTFGLGIAACPTILLSLTSQGHRAFTLFNTVLLLALLLLMYREGTRRPRVWLLAAATVALTGMDLAADDFLLLWGLGPFVVAAVAVVVIWPSRRHLTFAVAAIVIGGLALGSSLLVGQLMHQLGFQRLGVPLRLANSTEIMSNLRLLWADLGDIFGAPIAGARLRSRVVSMGLTVLGVAALLGIVARAVALLRRRSTDHAEDINIVFWASSVLLVAGSFVFSTFVVDTTSTRYLLTFFYAVVAVIPLWAAHGNTRQLLAGLAAAAFCVASAFSLVSLVGIHYFQPTFTVDLPQVIPTLEAHRLTRGYAGYWEANPISWQTEGGVSTYPVWDTPAMHRFVSNVDTSWYDSGDPRTASFLLIDPGAPNVTQTPNPPLGTPLDTIRVGRFIILVYSQDIGPSLP